MTDPKFLKQLDGVYYADKLYEYLTEYNVGDRVHINPFRVALHLERLYSRIEQLEKKLEQQEDCFMEQND